LSLSGYYKFITLMMIKFLFSFFFLLISFQLAAQSLNFLVKDKSKEPLVGATVQVIRATDSITYNEVTDVNGVAQFPKISIGIYTIYANYIGFKENISNIRVEKNSYNLNIILEESALDLGEVIIIAKRPLITQEDD